MANVDKGIDSDLIRGHIDTIILKVLKTGDRYGYEIIKDVETKSQGTYELKQPTLYSCLKRLESQGLISSYWTDSDIGGKRHYYKLTARGQEDLERNQNEWLKSKSIIDSLIYEDVAPNLNVPYYTEEGLQDNSASSVSAEPVLTIEAQEDFTEVTSEELSQVFDDINSAKQTDEQAFNSQLAQVDNEQLESAIEENNLNLQDQPEEIALEKDHFFFQRQAEERKKQAELEAQPTPLELVAGGSSIEEVQQINEEPYKPEEITSEVSVQQDSAEEYEFSTFAEETRRQKELARMAQEQQAALTQQDEDKKQAALELLYQNTDLVSKVEDTESEQSSFTQTVNSEEFDQNEQMASFAAQTQVQPANELPTNPTFEQKQTLKMFEGNKVNGSFTEQSYKNRLSELSQYALHHENAAPRPVKTSGQVEYQPQEVNDLKGKFERMGISVRVHHKLESAPEVKTHLFKNKIRLARAWITFGITSVLLAISLIVLCSTRLTNMSVSCALPLYLPAYLIVFAYPVITTIIYWTDPQKRVPARYAPRISLISSCLFFIQALVITYAINLQTGLVSFAQKGYNHLGWLVPWIASTAILISSITYYFLYKSQKFHS